MAAQAFVDGLIRRQSWMDGVAEKVQGLVGAAYGALGPRGRQIKNLMHGTAVLGHPLHPAVTDVPIGAWLTGLVADTTGQRGAGDTALVVGLGAATLAALSGYTDFHETYGQERRIALAHGAAMTTATALMAGSLLLRVAGGDGPRRKAKALSAAGLALTMASGYLGGDLVFGIGTMVNRNAFLEAPEDFVDAGASGDFPEGAMRRVQAGAAAVLVVRQSGRLVGIGGRLLPRRRPPRRGRARRRLRHLPLARLALPAQRRRGGRRARHLLAAALRGARARRQGRGEGRDPPALSGERRLAVVGGAAGALGRAVVTRLVADGWG